MQPIRVPLPLFNAVCQIAASAPVPYSQSQSMWKALEQLKPEPETPMPEFSPQPGEARGSQTDEQP